ncbi:17598_t:CDS:2 [Entrophospora sp. SA101]|nr:17598_t:CDS:2 [Entrophospora sp. SA101]
MTGPYGGVIGAKPEVIFQRAKYGLPAKMTPTEDNGQFNGVVLEFDDNNKVVNDYKLIDLTKRQELEIDFRGSEGQIVGKKQNEVVLEFEKDSKKYQVLMKVDKIKKVRKLKKVYGSRTVLQNVSFAVKKGSIHGFIGPNGAGKTTTLNCLMSGVKPNAQFAEDLRVEDFVHLAGQLRNIPSQKKILLYFVSVMHDPDILVLDEPTSGLDPSYRGILLRQLEQVRQRGGTVLISSHILSDLQKLVDATTLIDKGKIVYTGEKPDDIEEMCNKLVLKDKIKEKTGQS